MKRLVPFLILSLFLLGVVSAIPIEGDEFLVADYLSEGVKEIVYEVTPAADMILTVSLTGSNGYAPELRIFEGNEEVAIETIIANRGRTATLTFLSHGEKSDVVSYRFEVIVGDGLPGAEYMFSYIAKEQNDGGSGVDAPENFDDALLLEFGEYEGFLGGDDSIDFYSLDLVNGETVTFTLTAQNKGSLGVALTDAEGFKKIDTWRYLDPAVNDAVLTSTFLSLRDQNVKLNVNGDVAYLFLIETDQPEPEVIEVTPLPPLPPTPPVVVEDEVEMDEDNSFLLLLIIIVLLAAGGVAGIFSWRMRKKAPKKKAKK